MATSFAKALSPAVLAGIYSAYLPEMPTSPADYEASAKVMIVMSHDVDKVMIVMR